MRRTILSLLTALLLMLTAHAGHTARAEGVPVWERQPVATVEATRLTPDVALHVFQVMAAQPDIAFEFKADGCYARAHIMIERMSNLFHVHSRKVWAFARSFRGLRPVPAVEALPDSLTVRLSGGQCIDWCYHVAPLVTVTDLRGDQIDYVIDPSLFDRPVTVGEWMACMMGGGYKAPYICVTELGEAPTLPDGRQTAGTGYHPGADPSEGADVYSREVMKKYKREAEEQRRAAQAAQAAQAGEPVSRVERRAAMIGGTRRATRRVACLPAAAQHVLCA
jgi:hypothetical protein